MELERWYVKHLPSLAGPEVIFLDAESEAERKGDIGIEGSVVELKKKRKSL
jgi:hypothetical protein